MSSSPASVDLVQDCNSYRCTQIYSSCSAIVELHAEQLAKDKEKAAALDRTFEIRWREIKEFHRTWSESVAELATLRRYVERKMVAREIWEY